MNKISPFLTLIIAFSALLFSGCATNIPMTCSLNEFVIMGTKVNNKDAVSFIYETNVADGLVKPFEKDKIKEVTGQAGFVHSESATLSRMLKEYMENKFINLSPDGQTTIKATLKDFWIEQYSTDSGGKQFLVAMVGGEINIMCVAKVKLLLTINRNGEEFNKIISITSEDNFVSGVGTGTSTSNIYRGKNSIEFTHARNINKANNKVIMMVNAYLEGLGL